jgi:glycosyltransferase involved in cell wall biosynthesis
MNLPAGSIILGAYSCRPYGLSEPGVAWDQLLLIAKIWVGRVILVTREKNRVEIEAALEKNDILNVEVHGVDLPKKLLFWKKGHIAMHMYYYIWQFLAFFHCKKIVNEGHVVLAHHLSFMSIRTNFIPFLGTKSILGPVGGAQLPPVGFESIVGKGLKPKLRTLSIKLMKYSPIWLSFINRVDLIIVANSDNLWIIPKILMPKCIVHQIGWVSVQNALYHRRSEQMVPLDKVNFLWCGRLIKWKGLELAIRSFHKAMSDGGLTRAELHIVGKGPDREYFADLVISLGIQELVVFHGFISEPEKHKIFDLSDICLFTSLHETTGTTLFEYFEYSKPVIAIRHAGPKEIVDATEACGVNVNSGIDKAIDDFSAAMIVLGRDLAYREEMGATSHDRLNSVYSYDEHSKFLESCYQRVLAS